MTVNPGSGTDEAPGTEEVLRVTVDRLRELAGEHQTELAVAVGLSPTGLSRRQSGKASWKLEDIDRLAAHWGIEVPDLLTGTEHAVSCLPAARTRPTLLPAPEPEPEPEAEPKPKPEPEPERQAAPDTTPERQPETTPAPEPAIAPAPTPTPPLQAPPQVLPPDPPRPVDGTAVAAEPCVLCGKPTTARAGGHPQHMYGLCVGAPLPAAEPGEPAGADGGEQPRPDAPSAPRGTRPRPAPAPLTDNDLALTIAGTVAAVLREHEGDMGAAQEALSKRAVQDVMSLFKSSRVGGRYEHKDFPPTEEILKKRSQKGADAIWEGRPKWRNTALAKAVKAGELDGPVDVVALDANAAYLAAWKTRLPLGRLVHSTTGVHDPKQAGVHLITPPEWDHPDIPSPLGARMEPGELWVTEPTLRLLMRCAKDDLCDPPVIHESWTSGSTEALLEKLRRTLVELRKKAVEEGDTLTVEYLKAMYSKFVSTIGESSMNREIRRPDWMHIIRSQAFANLWFKADRARKAGLTLVQMSGTDELHLAGGDWRGVFSEGRGMADMKIKETYTLGTPGGER
ncbi:helix-turn-helix transcriptional regulator [Streptomyces albiaxialis]